METFLSYLENNLMINIIEDTSTKLEHIHSFFYA